MHKHLFAAAMVAGTSAVAADVDDRLTDSEKRIHYLENRIANQEQTMLEKEATGFRIRGLIEIEAMSGDGDSDISLATAELGIYGRVNDMIEGELTFLYEGETTDVDVAAIHIAPSGSHWSSSIGQIYVPFGAFETNMISDPLTLELGETRENAVRVNFQSDGLLASAYLFNGSNKQHGGADDRIDNFGLSLAYAAEGFVIGYGYINDIGDSDNLQDAINANLGSNDIQAHVPGHTLNARFEFGAFDVIAEYLAAGDHFEVTELPFSGTGAKPSAMNIEAGYTFELAGKAATFAVGAQRSREAEVLELPKSRVMSALSVAIAKNTTLAFEYARDEDYAGEKSNTLTAQLAVEF